MDLALHPRFVQNQLLYFTYSKPGERPSPARSLQMEVRACGNSHARQREPNST